MRVVSELTPSDGVTVCIYYSTLLNCNCQALFVKRALHRVMLCNLAELSVSTLTHICPGDTHRKDGDFMVLTAKLIYFFIKLLTENTYSIHTNFYFFKHVNLHNYKTSDFCVKLTDFFY